MLGTTARKWRLWSLIMVWGLVLALGGAVSADDLVVHFIDVGQGDSVLLETSGGAKILIDAGVTKAGREVVVPYLENLGITALDLVVITHPHADHIGGLIPVLETYPVGQVLADGQVHTSKTYEELLQLILTREIPFHLARPQGQLTVEGIDEILILNPEEPLLKGLNNNSVVLWIRHGAVTMLFTGDIEAEAEARIMAANRLRQADILKVAHHGSNTSTTRVFLQKVNPRHAIISAGAGNAYGHPDSEIVRRLERADAEVWRTDLQGTITVVSDGESYRITAEKPAGP